MKVVTTMHKAGLDEYGHRWIEGLKKWPKADFCLYAEGFDCEKVPTVRVETLERLNAFKDKHRHYKAPNWRFDIVRFSHKVFAAYDAFRHHDGLCVWTDADVVTHKKIPSGYIESLLPKGDYIAHFGRAGHYTETGFWIVDGRHPEHGAFFDTWIEWFESGAFTQLHEWHDCTTLDATLRLFKDKVRAHNLSGDYAKVMHPMAKVELAKYLDHCKGARKATGVSPENPHR